MSASQPVKLLNPERERVVAERILTVIRTQSEELTHRLTETKLPDYAAYVAAFAANRALRDVLSECEDILHRHTNR